jgi:mannose-6-phosphate isomerase-like protein (cupin superfamily)
MFDDERNVRTAEVASRPESEPIRIEASDADIAALNSLLRRGVRVGNENCDADLHLQEMIPKPWGQEYRVYADDFLDVWHLQINPGHATSMHAHPRKTTYLLCLSGQGRTTTLAGQIEVTRGTVLRIGRGAFHTTENTGVDEPLMIVEVETPRNKYDLVRLRDGYQRAGTGYEQRATNLTVTPRKVAFLPNTRMCKNSPCGSYAFEILSGMDVHYRRRSAGAYLVPLGVAEIISDQMAILTDHPADTRRPNLDSYYLGIRRVA